MMLCDDLLVLIYATTGVVLTLNKQLVRLHCCLCVNLKVLVISVWCRMRLWYIPGDVALMHAPFAVQMHYNGDHGSSTLILVCWMYATGVTLAVHKQRVRLYCFVCMRLNLNEKFIGVRCSFMRSWFHPHMPFGCVNIHCNNGDDRSLLIFVRLMYGTGVALSLDEQGVRLHCCVRVLEFEEVVGVWYGMRS